MPIGAARAKMEALRKRHTLVKEYTPYEIALTAMGIGIPTIGGKILKNTIGNPVMRAVADDPSAPTLEELNRANTFTHGSVNMILLIAGLAILYHAHSTKNVQLYYLAIPWVITQLCLPMS